jgi:hypothetical protein
MFETPKIEDFTSKNLNVEEKPVDLKYQNIYNEISKDYEYLQNTRYNLTCEEFIQNKGGSSADFANYIYNTYKDYKPECYNFQFEIDNGRKKISHIAILFPSFHYMEFGLDKLAGVHHYKELSNFENIVFTYLYTKIKKSYIGTFTKKRLEKVIPNNKHELRTNNTWEATALSLINDNSFEKQLFTYLKEIINIYRDFNSTLMKVTTESFKFHEEKVEFEDTALEEILEEIKKLNDRLKETTKIQNMVIISLERYSSLLTIHLEKLSNYRLYLNEFNLMHPIIQQELKAIKDYLLESGHNKFIDIASEEAANLAKSYFFNNSILNTISDRIIISDKGDNLLKLPVLKN